MYCLSFLQETIDNVIIIEIANNINCRIIFLFAKLTPKKLGTLHFTKVYDRIILCGLYLSSQAIESIKPMAYSYIEFYQ